MQPLQNSAGLEVTVNFRPTCISSKSNTVYTRVQVEFFGCENGLKKSTSTYIRENMRHLPNHKKMPKFTATSQVTELSK